MGSASKNCRSKSRNNVLWGRPACQSARRNCRYSTEREGMVYQSGRKFSVIIIQMCWLFLELSIFGLISPTEPVTISKHNDQEICEICVVQENRAFQLI